MAGRRNTSDADKNGQSTNKVGQRDVRCGSCGRVPSLNTRERRTPTPSNTPKRIPHAIADPSADFGPPDIRRIEIRNMEMSKDEEKFTSCSQTSTRHEPRNNGIPSILLLPPTFHGTIESGEHASPNAEVATCNWGTCFDGRYRTNQTFTL